MQINYTIVVPVLIAVIVLIIYLIIRNSKDEKKFEEDINKEADTKPEKHDSNHI